MNHLAFYGRSAELAKLYNAWLNVNQGRAQWVSLVAESGTGKTRLVQEFYRYISDATYRRSAMSGAASDSEVVPQWEDVQGYWPERLPIELDKLGLNPEPATIGETELEDIKDLPWLWWGLRGQDPGKRNPAESPCATRDSLYHLEIHSAVLAVQKARREANIAAGIEVSKKLASLAIGGWLDTAISIAELVQAGRHPLKRLLGRAGVVAERRDLQIKLETLLVDTIIKFLDEDRPVILVLDDTQWLDIDTINFLDALVDKVHRTSAKLMIVSTSWAREWQGSAVQKIHHHFHGEKTSIALGGIEREYAEKFLLSNLSGLSQENVCQIVERANGNFRYLTEIAVTLARDPRRFFVGGRTTNKLSTDGSAALESSAFALEELIKARYLALPLDVQDVLMLSSYQGARFSPKVTSLAGILLEPEDALPEAELIEAINQAENPGAMIFSVNQELREFLQGPYWRLIRNRIQELKWEGRVGDIYKRVLAEHSGRISADIVEALLANCLDIESDVLQRIVLLGQLMEIAIADQRYHLGLIYVGKVSSLINDLGANAALTSAPLPVPLIHLGLKILNQFGYGASKASKVGNETIWENLALLKLKQHVGKRIDRLQELDEKEIEQTIEWCVEAGTFFATMGHQYEKLAWKSSLGKLREALWKRNPDNEHLLHLYICDRIEWANWCAPFAKDRAGWDEVFAVYKEVAMLVMECDYVPKNILAGWAQISILSKGIQGRQYYPDTTEWGSDVHNYIRAANYLGDALATLELDDDESETPESIGSKLEYALLMGGAQVLDLSFMNQSSLEIAIPFIDRLFEHARALLIQFTQGKYTSLALIESAVEAGLAASKKIRQVSENDSDVRASSEEAHNLSPQKPWNVVILESRSVAAGEYAGMMETVSKAVTRCREQGHLSYRLICLFAEFKYWDLCFKQSIEDDLSAQFRYLLELAVLCEDGKRLILAEGTDLLPAIVWIYDKFLQSSSDSHSLWGELQNAYSDLRPHKLAQLVEDIRMTAPPDCFLRQPTAERT